MLKNCSTAFPSKERIVSNRIIQLGVVLCGTSVFFYGLMMLTGWYTQKESVVFAFPDFPLMVANTAFCALLIAASILLLAFKTFLKFAGIPGTIAAAIALSTAIEWALGISIGLDHLLVEPFTEVGQEVPGRMSPHTANTLTMLGLAGAFLSTANRRNWPLVIPASLAAVSLSIAVSVLIGYAFDYQIPLANTMALQTAASILVLCIGILGLTHLEARRRGVFLRWWLTGPAIAFMLICPLLVRFGFLARTAAAGDINIVDVGEIMSFGLTAIAVAAIVASHFAVEQWKAKTKLLKVQSELEAVNEALEIKVLKRTESLERHKSHLRSLTNQLTIAEERERQRLAGELHDYLAQMLVVARMQFSTLKKLNNDDNEFLGCLNQTAEILDKCLKYTREVMAQLSPVILFDQGLIPALYWLAERKHGRNLNVRVNSDVDEVDLSEEEEILIYQAVRELIHNVAKHTSTDSARIEIFGNRQSRILTIDVIDEGEGFDPTMLAPEDKLEGYGLFAIRERLEVHGGRLLLDSVKGKGTRVSIEMPLKLSSGDTSQISGGEVDQGKAQSASRDENKRIRVVLVEDHQLVREGLRLLMERECRMDVVAEAGDGEEALEVIRLTRPDIVLMDVNMPGLNGIEATRRLRETDKETKVLGLSMQDDETTRQRMKEAGADGFVSKSAVTDTIRERILETLAE